MKIDHNSDPNESGVILEYENHTKVNNRTNYLFGFIILVLNKIRHELRGYTSTRGFSSHMVEKAVAHDLRAVRRWSDYLKKYNNNDNSVYRGKKILELGPGADLGVGLFLLAEKAESYTAVDVHNLIKSTPPELYKHLFEYLEKSAVDNKSVEELKLQLELTNGDQSERLNYHHIKDFDLSVFPENGFDLVVSNSAFQQFDDPVQTISQLSRIVKSGAQFIALIDLKTHTKVISSRDPLNIYRYNDLIYQPLRFKGSPNRIRPYEYENALKSHGWTDIKIFPRILLTKDYLKKVNHTLSKKFRNDINQMQNLTVVICATKL